MRASQVGRNDMIAIGGSLLQRAPVAVTENLSPSACMTRITVLNSGLPSALSAYGGYRRPNPPLLVGAADYAALIRPSTGYRL
jgi:hypothetical protein